MQIHSLIYDKISPRCCLPLRHVDVCVSWEHLNCMAYHTFRACNRMLDAVEQSALIVPAVDGGTRLAGIRSRCYSTCWTICCASFYWLHGNQQKWSRTDEHTTLGIPFLCRFCAPYNNKQIVCSFFLHFVLNDPKFSVHYTRLLLHAFMSCLEFLCFMIYVKDANMSEGMAKMKVIWSWIERIWSNQMCVKDIKFSRQS